LKPKLNTQKVMGWMIEKDRPIAWLARTLGLKESTMYYRLQNRTTKDIDKLAYLMGCDPRDLIEMVK